MTIVLCYPSCALTGFVVAVVVTLYESNSSVAPITSLQAFERSAKLEPRDTTRAIEQLLLNEERLFSWCCLLLLERAQPCCRLQNQVLELTLRCAQLEKESHQARMKLHAISDAAGERSLGFDGSNQQQDLENVTDKPAS